MSDGQGPGSRMCSVPANGLPQWWKVAALSRTTALRPRRGACRWHGGSAVVRDAVGTVRRGPRSGAVGRQAPHRPRVRRIQESGEVAECEDSVRCGLPSSCCCPGPVVRAANPPNRRRLHPHPGRSTGAPGRRVQPTVGWRRESAADHFGVPQRVPVRSDTKYRESCAWLLPLKAVCIVFLN